MEDNAPTIGNNNGIDYMPIETMKRQVNLIQQAMKDIMIDGTHFGKIPGCGDKPTLLKPGAEKICLLFRLRASFQVEEKKLDGWHKEFYVVCSLMSSDGSLVGQGVGSASTMESKHRWRYAEAESTGQPVPKEYWALKNEGRTQEMQEALGGQSFVAKKTEDGWMICKRGDHKVENSDIADVYNTVLKMAKKRAHVDATLTATAASDLFTQDLEDLPAEQLQSKVAAPNKESEKPKKQAKKAKSEPETSTLINKDDCYVYDITEAKKKVSVEDGKRIIGDVFRQHAGFCEDQDNQTVLFSTIKIKEWEEFLLGEPSNSFNDDEDDLPGF